MKPAPLTCLGAEGRREEEERDSGATAEKSGDAEDEEEAEEEEEEGEEEEEDSGTESETGMALLENAFLGLPFFFFSGPEGERGVGSELARG